MVRGGVAAPTSLPPTSLPPTSLPQLTSKCLVCQDRVRSVAVLPCNHCVLCVVCSTDANLCAYCNVPITHKTNVNVV